ncbi:MAG: DUF2585 family protein [Pyrinomonadaceae bacterium]|nr:DUF2585 family protein [Pyrinomonadaceae bacterium]
MAAVRACGGVGGRHVPNAQPGPFMVVFLWPALFLGERHLDSHNSQHLLDPYAFTHVLHGFVFFWLLSSLLPRTPRLWQFTLAILLEGLWEVFENTEFIIQRYREATAALGYYGDSVANSLGDVVTCGIGFLIAQRIGFRRSFVVFVATELVLLIWIRDSLLLEILMLIYPIDSLKTWQMGH